MNIGEVCEVLDSLWESALLKGLCRGLEKESNSFGVNNLIMANGTEVILVSQTGGGELVVHEFCRVVGGTELGNQAREILEEKGLPVKYCNP